jgi:hypothetical protein
MFSCAEASERLAPELFRLGLLTVLEVGPLSAYCSAAAQLRQTEEAIERMAKGNQRGHALTIKGSTGGQVIDPLPRIASQAMADMQLNRRGHRSCACTASQHLTASSAL